MSARLCGIGDEAAPDLGRQVEVHRDSGLRGLELRALGGVGLHDLTDAQVAAAAEAVDRAGLEVPCVATPIGGWSVSVGVPDAQEEELLRRVARRALLFGCDRLRIMSYPGDGRPDGQWRDEVVRKVRRLVDLAGEHGVTLLHENCHGWAGTSAERSLELVDAAPGLRLLFDVGNGVAHGYASLPFLREVVRHVDHVHLKDGRGVPGGTVFGWPGEGDAQLVECLSVLRGSGYDGWFSVEPHIERIPHLGVAGDPARLETGYREYLRRTGALLDREATA